MNGKREFSYRWHRVETSFSPFFIYAANDQSSTVLPVLLFYILFNIRFYQRKNSILENGSGAFTLCFSRRGKDVLIKFLFPWKRAISLGIIVPLSIQPREDRVKRNRI